MNIDPELFQGFYDAGVIQNWLDTDLLSRLDRPEEEPETDLQAEWKDDGLVVLPNFIPDFMLTRYANAWIKDNEERPGGWPFDVPYMYIPALLDMLSYLSLIHI